MIFEQYWVFAAVCLAVVLLLVRMVIREHITLQASLIFVGLLSSVTLIALMPTVARRISMAMGFELPSNFFFAVGIGTLVVLHISILVTLSRVELRSITATQELALLREQLDRLSKNP